MEMIGFVGLGTIGGAIAGNIRKAGYPMMVRDILPEAAQPLIDGGARAGRIARRGSPALPGSVHFPPGSTGSGASGPRARRPFAGSSRRQCLCDLSSSSPDLIRRIEAEFRLRGAGSWMRR